MTIPDVITWLREAPNFQARDQLLVMAEAIQALQPAPVVVAEPEPEPEIEAPKKRKR